MCVPGPVLGIGPAVGGSGLSQSWASGVGQWPICPHSHHPEAHEDLQVTVHTREGPGSRGMGGRGQPGEEMARGEEEGA